MLQQAPRTKLAALVLTGILVLLAACRSAAAPGAATTAATAAPAPTADPGPRAAVLMTEDAGPGADGRFVYHLSTISVDGRVLGAVSPHRPAALPYLPTFAVAGRDVYYLDGDADLRVLHGDGSTAPVRSLPGGPNDRIVFSVSPDGARLAYSVVHLTPVTCPPNLPPCAPDLGVSLRVGGVAGGDVEIFSGSTAEYPVGWIAGRLVVAIGQAFIQNRGERNPYLATEYRVVDPAGADRIASTATACPYSAQGGPTGPLVAAGTACVQGASLRRIDLDRSGSTTLGQAPGGEVVVSAALSPAGTRAAFTTIDAHGVDDRVQIASGGAVTAIGPGFAGGWFDDSRLLVVTGWSTPHPTFAILDVDGRTTTPLAVGIPGGIVGQSARFLALG